LTNKNTGSSSSSDQSRYLTFSPKILCLHSAWSFYSSILTSCICPCLRALISTDSLKRLKSKTILVKSKKETLDYYVIAVVIVSWMRFFGYFLVIRNISKLLSTLIKMVYDGLSFILIVSSYLLLMSTVYTTLFGDSMEEYATITLSLRYLFDAMLGAYVYTDNPDYEMSNGILTMIHVFMSNIFLLNFLVAILSTVYEIMQEHGEFAFKKNKYEFIEKYSVAMMDQHGYSELVMHPPPLNIFSFFLLPCVIRPEFMKKGAECFSRIMFWMENMFYIVYFIFSEVILFPLIYFKVMITVGYLADWKRLLPLTVFWIVFGPFVLLYSLAKDLFFYLKILCDYQEDED
jgi:hypothetical protein